MVKVARRRKAKKIMLPTMSKAATPDDLESELPLGLRKIFQRLRSFVKREAPQLDEQVKWGGICWVGKGVVCYAHAVGDRADFGFFKGVMLKDPVKILEGDGKFLRHVKVRREADIREKELAGLLAQALTADGGSKF